MISHGFPSLSKPDFGHDETSRRCVKGKRRSATHKYRSWHRNARRPEKAQRRSRRAQKYCVRQQEPALRRTRHALERCSRPHEFALLRGSQLELEQCPRPQKLALRKSRRAMEQCIRSRDHIGRAPPHRRSVVTHIGGADSAREVAPTRHIDNPRRFHLAVGGWFPNSRKFGHFGQDCNYRSGREAQADPRNQNARVWVPRTRSQMRIVHCCWCNVCGKNRSSVNGRSWSNVFGDWSWCHILDVSLRVGVGTGFVVAVMNGGRQRQPFVQPSVRDSKKRYEVACFVSTTRSTSLSGCRVQHGPWMPPAWLSVESQKTDAFEPKHLRSAVPPQTAAVGPVPKNWVGGWR